MHHHDSQWAKNGNIVQLLLSLYLFGTFCQMKPLKLRGVLPFHPTVWLWKADQLWEITRNRNHVNKRPKNGLVILIYFKKMFYKIIFTLLLHLFYYFFFTNYQLTLPWFWILIFYDTESMTYIAIVPKLKSTKQVKDWFIVWK